MNQLFLLNLISDLIKEDKPTVEQVRCVRVIIDNMIKEFQTPSGTLPYGVIFNDSELSQEAKQARKDLLE